jgi:ABC-type Fe3+/spermidine/putrescine transport system ATPase subunit
MGAGLLHQVAPPEVIYAAPADRFVAEFLGYTGFLPAEVAGADSVRLPAVPGGPMVPARVPPGARGGGVLAFRPGQVELEAPGSGLRGAVAARVYRGGVFEYRLRLGPHDLAAVSPRAVPEGEPVGLTLRDPLFFPG